MTRNATQTGINGISTLKNSNIPIKNGLKTCTNGRIEDGEKLFKLAIFPHPKNAIKINIIKIITRRKSLKPSFPTFEYKNDSFFWKNSPSIYQTF